MKPVMKSRKRMQDGLLFDSDAELRRYNDLRCLAMAKQIKGFKVKPEWELIPKNDKFRAMKYTADFLVIYPDGREEVEDVKGSYYNRRDWKGKRVDANMAAIRVFEIKRKLLYHLYKIEVKVVQY